MIQIEDWTAVVYRRLRTCLRRMNYIPFTETAQKAGSTGRILEKM
ncbi:MAG: hypothetical protein ACLU80_15245 [Dorea sp.]